MGTDHSGTSSQDMSVLKQVGQYLFGGEVKRLNRAHLLIAPAVVWYVIFLLLPLAVIIYYSFLTYTSYAVEFTFTFDAWTNAVFTKLTFDVFVRSLIIGVGVTALTLVFGYPLAYYLRFYASEIGGIILLLFLIIPFWTSGLIRTTGWIPLLGRTGVINTVFLGIGITNQPLPWLLYSPFSQVLGYLQTYIVFMAAPIYISLSRIDDNLLAASQTLRGSPIRTFRRIVWPLSLPGVAIGVIFVFVLSIGDFMVPQFLSGGTSTISMQIYSYVNSGLNYPAASALSITLLLVILLGVVVLVRFVDISEIVQAR